MTNQSITRGSHIRSYGKPSRRSAGVSHIRSRREKQGERRSRIKPVRARWSTEPTSTPHRRGSGIRYGDLDLSPHDSYHIKPASKSRHGKLRVAVLGGNEEVGRNMSILEYEDDIILIDMGVQFPEEGMLGVDVIIPNISYLKGKEQNVRAVIITHAHNDHIGAIPHLMPFLPNVPIFSSPLTLAMIAKKLEYHTDVHVEMKAVDNDTHLELGAFHVTFFGVSHSVPSSHGVIIETPVGKVVHTGDFKLDHNPQDAEGKANLQRLQDLGSENVLLLMSDSTNASVPGFQVMEREVETNLEKIFQDAAGRLIVGMISTNILRLGQMIKLAEQFGRKVAIEGLSIKTNLEIAEQLGYVSYLPETVLEVKELASYPDDKQMIICSGAQGENNAAFSRIADGKHPLVEIRPGDTVVFSSSVIPGNERTVQAVTDKFYRAGARVINVKMLDIHAGGHARQDDLKAVIQHVKPRYLMPIEGHHAFLHAHAQAGVAAGLSRENIFISDNGQVVEFDRNGGRLTSDYLPAGYVFVDGKTIDEVDLETLRQRKHVGEEGLIVVTFAWKNDRLYGLVNVKIYGFRKESMVPKTAQNIALFVEKELQKIPEGLRGNLPKWRQSLEDTLGKELFEATNRQPLILVTVIPVK